MRGTLSALGTSDNKITFTSNSTNPRKGDWVGIELDNNQGGKILASNIVGEYSDRFIEIMNSSSGEIINISHSEIRKCEFGFLGYDSSSFLHTIVLNNLNVKNCTNGYRHARNAIITNSFFSGGERGIMCWNINSNIKISNTEISYFSIYGTHLQGGATIDNCNINNNETGIWMLKDLVIKNSAIRLNTNGIWTAHPTPYSGENIYDNIICDNIENNFKHSFSFPVNLGRNCWCSNDENEISQTIYDGYDDVSLGIVTFTPFNIDCTSSLNTETFSIKNDLSFYPNPASDEISLSENVEGNYKIYSINGVLVKQGIITKKLNVSQLSKGLYLIKVTNLNQTEFSTKKLIKK